MRVENRGFLTFALNQSTIGIRDQAEARITLAVAHSNQRNSTKCNTNSAANSSVQYCFNYAALNLTCVRSIVKLMSHYCMQISFHILKCIK